MAGLTKLQDIGAQKIFETTHIAKKFVEDILNQRFTTMSKVQFMGFISILEREYSIDLHELQDAYAASSGTPVVEGKEPFVISEQGEVEASSTNKNAYIFVGLLVVGALYMLFKSDSSPQEESKEDIEVVVLEQELNNSIIEKAKLNLSNLEANATNDTKVDTVVEPTHTNKFEVIPRSKLWVGIVDLDTFKRTQKMTSYPFELDPEKEWLLVMGHGYVNFDVHGEEQEHKDKNKVWYSYENGTLSKISRREFTEKNEGKSW